MFLTFDTVLSNIGKVLSINSSAIIFVFRDHHKDWLIYSGGTNRPGDLFYLKQLTQIGNLVTQILESDFHRPSLLDFL